MTRSLKSLTIDPAGVIVDIVSEWTPIATSSEYAFSAVDLIGRPLAGFIAGDETRDFYSRLFAKVRGESEPMTLRYRCDVPNHARLFEMRIAPATANALRLDHRLVSQFELPPTDGMVQPAQQNVQCSVCARLRHGGAWRPWRVALTEGHLRGAHPRQTVYKICSDCEGAAFPR